MADKPAELEGESKTFMEYVRKLGALDLSTSIQALRDRNEQTAQSLKGDFVFSGSKEDKVIQAKDGDTNYELSVTILRPELETGESYGKITIYYHGGGWVWSSRNTHMKFCEMIASQCKCVVVNVEYRLSPENKFPACYVDAEAVVNWCQTNRKYLANNDSALIGVAGDSAGANISASVCHLVKGLDYQILIYPSMDLFKSKEYPSYTTYGEGYLLSNQLMAWFANHFLRSAEDAKDPRCSPMHRTDFTGLPPALFIPCECDPLADQAAEYQKKLQNAGVKTEFKMLKGTVHGYVTKPGYFKETSGKTVKHITDFLNKLV